MKYLLDTSIFLWSLDAFHRLNPEMTHAHAFAVADLPAHHTDPFDRMLIAQARSEDMVLLTSDGAFLKYKVKTLWCGGS